MSYELIKRVTFDERRKRVTVCSASNNVTPRRYDSTWEVPLEAHGWDYDRFKRVFAQDLFDGNCEFLPSCASKAHLAYKAACGKLGVRLAERSCHPLYSAACAMFPFSTVYDHAGGRFEYDPPEARAGYEAFRDSWCDAFVEELDALLAKSR